MKTLVTGANGQLGKELGRVMASYEIIGTDIAELDITNRENTERFINDIRPDIIINCAAMTNVDACETAQDAAFRINALGARNLAMAASQAGAALAHISTDYVFPGDGGTPLCEWDTPNPKTVYGKSKLLGEKYVSEFCEKHYILRTSWLYGSDGHNFVKTIVRAAKENPSLKVVNDQRGCPTYTADLARHLLKIAASGEYGLYHCAGNGDCTWYDFAKKITELSGASCNILPCTTAEYPRPAPRPAYSVLDNMMLRCTSGDEMRQWEEALADFFTDYGGGL
jgi:dTDP-4-dehydrorhamnose reductase